MKSTGISINDVPDIVLKKWQEIADLLAELFSVPAALIMRTENDYMEVFVSSNSENNPYAPGDKEKWYGLYCETVIKTQKQLVIPDATKDPVWDHNPDLKLGMICYMGVPINYPDNTPFGTLCVLDTIERSFSEEFNNLLLRFKNVVELDISFLLTYNKKYYEYESLYKNIREGVFLTKPTGEILSANPEACRMLCMTEEEICQLGRGGVINPDDPNLPSLLAEREKNWMVRGELTFKRKDGLIFPVDFTSTVFDFEPGETRTVIYFRDTTERKQAEKELRQSEEKYRKLFDNSLVGVFSTTLSGEILYVNRALAELLEYDDINELSSKNISIIYKNISDRERFIEILRRDRVIREAENTLLTANKREVNVSVSVVFNGTGFDGFVVDNTLRNNLLNELKRKNFELDHLNQTKDKFFSIISHDLRTPFNTILGFSEILSDEVNDLSKDEIRVYALNILNSAKNTLELLDNLLLWSNSHSGDMVLKRETIKLKEIIGNIIALAEVTAGRKGVFIENMVDSELCVDADRNTLNTIIRNLISNAIKYSNSGGVVIIDTSVKGSEAVISVSDNGVGMDSDTLKALFSKRDVISRPGTLKEAGTGLGLVLCKEFVEMNGGSIWAESREDSGSKFFFTLPLCKVY